ncbi:MAG: hypothetical protein SNH80_08340, partial [Rikenellaceae bacterium]
CVILLIALIALSYVPPFEICGVQLRRVDILSTLPPIKVTEPSIEVQDQLVVGNAEPVHGEATPEDIIPIEDYDSAAQKPIERIYAQLEDPHKGVRIAVMGDSFIEGDILTADLREGLQTLYGGEGVGFVPFAYKRNDIRPTIKIDSKDWVCYSIMERDKLPENISSSFSYAGWITIPERDGATTTWRTTKARKHIARASRVRILFVSTSDATVAVECNNEAPIIHNFKASQRLQQITISRSDIHTIKLTVKSGAEGFIGYGAHFEGDPSSGGVTLDNLPIRSNNGSAMFAASRLINSQITKLTGGYDLIFLQYGLNVIQPTINGYTRYGSLLAQMIRHLKSHYPHAAIVVLGVSDRCTQRGTELVPMSEVQGLERFQRDVARSEGVLFWSIREAMKLHGGMAEFANRGWASKDYTHITFAGGKVIASELCRAIKESQLNNLKSQDNAE